MIRLDETSYSVVEGGGIMTVCAVLGNVMVVGGMTLEEVTSSFILSPGTTGNHYATHLTLH